MDICVKSLYAHAMNQGIDSLDFPKGPPPISELKIGDLVDLVIQHERSLVGHRHVV